jgi:mycothiol synthase
VRDFSTRPATRGDASAINDLLAAAEAVDQTGEHHSAEDVVEMLENPMIVLEHDWVVAQRDGQVVGHCWLLPREPAGGKVRISIEGAVHPQHRRTGIGLHLVALMVERAHAHARERGLEAMVAASAPSTNSDAEAVFAELGLRPERWQFEMVADLHEEGVGSDPPSVPEGYTLSTWEGVNQEEMRAAHNRAFVGHYAFSPWGEDMWRQWVSGSRHYRPELSLVLRDEQGTVAAYIQASEYDAMQAATGKRDVFLSSVGTAPEFRRRGLATLLLRHALHRARQAGFDSSTLTVDSENPSGALAVYERVGFRTTVQWTDYGLASGAG